MKKLFYTLLLSLSLLFTHTITAQEAIEIGKTYTIQSKVLNEDRKIQVYLPPAYNDTQYPDQKYPVIYLLDGESNFNYLTAYLDKLSRYPYPSIPEMIIVGVVNTNRTRDLTPTKVTSESMSTEQSKKIKGENGGNDTFFRFLKEEVFSYIDTNYRTLDYKILIGHSFGGITALNNLLNYTDMFNAYIVHDPSIWWDNKVILREYTDGINQDFKHRRLFLTQVGESENKGHLTDHYSAIKEFDTLLSKNTPATLSYKYVAYEGEDHGSIPLKGNLDGLRYIFNGYRINFKELKNNPTLLQETFEALNKQMHYDFKPTEKFLDTVIKYFSSTDDTKTVDQLTKYKNTLYKK
ncbi:alpha/beta hydrolase [Myroides odoratimimus]|uniref:alpha/beta hydrolase n=1 Tax=Myroides odoratimimus TaxID=76832 RepID=UPI001CE06961|nr:alpha/beta hydrolase-fold protein [Myroides odoratimimus]MCA4791805.1 alpha/beta hydrolase [Myroides odoratimimus]MCA4805650.1 alpha/beta hydrolase [Myroides odoratimimus]MCA4819066.1 alpha/beta hydrolase [Myroides odoratimimus]MDM1059173.1 alpha/beta hydrolase [Myroides odoratimimus]MDM1095842.1 alpha/beta hydrolase [Myroides odoratimimus]